MSFFNILITGANGQLGLALQDQFLLLREFKAFTLSHTDLDITALQDNLDDYMTHHAIDAVINCAAYTAVDKAESEAENCWAVNAFGTRNVARACNRRNIPLIHFSTDYVYHNELRRPLKESDVCTPKNVYGTSKLAGEQKARFHNPKTIILRTSWLYARRGNNFMNTIIALASSRSDLNIVDDQIGAPTWVTDLAKATTLILSQVLSNPDLARWYGIYNCANQGAISWFNFAAYFIQRLGLPCKVHPVPSAEFPRPATRPAYSVFDLTKIEDTFRPGLRDWKSALEECLELNV